MAAITINLVLSEGGLFERAQNAEEEHKKAAAREKLELKLADMQAEKLINNRNYTEGSSDYNYLTEELEKEGFEVDEENGNIVTVDGWKFEIDRSVPKIEKELGKGENIPTTPDEESELAVVAKETDTSNLVRKTEIPIADLFEITWESDGIGEEEYTITGNLNFNNTAYSSTQIDNTSNLEIGTYKVTCKITSPEGKTATAEKEINVTTLAKATVTNASNTNVDAKAIYSEYDLAFFSSLVNGGQNTINAKVMNDLNLNNISHKVDGTTGNDLSFNSIGNSTNKYKGIFDGNEKSISNIYINSAEAQKGLFGSIENATIKNITLASGTIQAQYDVGGIVGNSNGASITNCKNNNVSVKSTGYISKNYTWNSTGTHSFSDLGGICGFSYNTNMENCTNGATLTGSYCGIGGIVGFDEGNIERTIKNCTNTANISMSLNNAAWGVGGIVGESYKLGVIENCTNNGNISVNINYVGGIVGELSSGKINNCNNTGDVTGNAAVGGISGQIFKISSSITPIINNSTNEGTIQASGYVFLGVDNVDQDGSANSWNSCSVGGIVGRTYAGNISLCSNKGAVLASGYEDLGGIVGHGIKGSTIEKCANYADISNANTRVLGGIVGFVNNCTINECFNVATINGLNNVGGIVGFSGYITVKNCYNTANVSGNNLVGGIIANINGPAGQLGYEYFYNCYNIGIISGNSYTDCWVGQCRYTTWDYLYTTKEIHDQVGDGTWYNSKGTYWEALEGTTAEIQSTMLTNLLNGNGSGKWTRDTTSKINNGYPYLINNVPK